MRRYGLILAVALVMGLVACDSTPPSSGARSIETMAGSPVVRQHDQQQLALGQSVYEAHCLRCHGLQAQGAAEWRKRDDDGFYPPPPLNGTGHAWHHSSAVLKNMIVHGSARDEQGRLTGKMPAWKDQLDDAEVVAVTAWFQSLWPDEVYAAWADRVER